jgi:hypothetical protein
MAVSPEKFGYSGRSRWRRAKSGAPSSTAENQDSCHPIDRLEIQRYFGKA